VTKTLLAVDDSVTMRKVLEITFSGEDFHVITAESSQSAIGKLAENPGVIIVDTVLGGEDGYALAKELRKRAPGAPIIMLASRYAPYDQARGRDAGADDFADKPFDTQQLIDKIRKIVVAKEASGGQAAAPPPPPTPAPTPRPAPAPAAAPPPPVAAAPRPQPPAPAPAPMSAAQPSGIGRGTQPSLAGSVPRSTLAFGEGGHPPAPGPAPMPPRAAPSAPGSAPVITTMGAQVNGQLAGKLGELGLTPQQADAVLALSREVVERVVWEVVPQLAETLIKEEIARLMKE
jgi:CheY-like chemotaxis protein